MRNGFDVVSAQFCIHYAFESEQRVRQMLKNVSEVLVPGGIFLGTVPNAYRLVKRAREEQALSFGNRHFRVVFEHPLDSRIGAFGVPYRFQLQDAIDDCPEYLVHFGVWKRLVIMVLFGIVLGSSLAAEYGLQLLHKTPFHEFFQTEIQCVEQQQLLRRMKVLDEKGRFSKEEWEVAGT